MRDRSGFENKWHSTGGWITNHGQKDVTHPAAWNLAGNIVAAVLALIDGGAGGSRPVLVLGGSNSFPMQTAIPPVNALQWISGKRNGHSGELHLYMNSPMPARPG